MANATFTQDSFLGGEWSQEAQGRVSDPRYITALAKCLNALPVETGAWTRRPGFRHGAHTRGGVAARVLPFDFQESRPYTIELTDGKIRFHSNRRADTSLSIAADAQAVTAISTASPAIVTTASAHGWATGTHVFPFNWGTKDPLILRRQFSITVTDTNKFSLQDAITGANIDGSTLAAFVSGSFGRIYEINAPYSTSQWQTLRSVQAEQQAVLLQNGAPPQTLSVATEPTDDADATFTLSPAQFVDGPYLDPVAGATITPASVSGVVGCTITSPTWSSTAVYSLGDFVVYSGTAYQSLQDGNINKRPDLFVNTAWKVVPQDQVLNPSTGLTSADIGRHVRLLSEPPLWVSATTYAAGVAVKYMGAYYTSLVSSNTGNKPGVDITKWAPTANAAIWTWGKISSLTGAVSTLIAASAGTLIGSNAWDNKANAFDSNYSNFAQVSGGAGYNIIPNSPYYIGKNFGGSPTAISYAKVFAPPTNVLLSASGNPSTLTLNLRGKNSAPANSADGTLLGSVGGISYDVAGYVVQIFSNDTSTTYQYIWIEAVITGGPAYGLNFAEIELFTTSAFSGTGVSIEIIGPALLYTSAITTWRLGLLNAVAGYPSCGTYHEGRLWLAGVVSNRLDAGRPAGAGLGLFNFAPTETDLTVSDSCAISYTLDGPSVNAIHWLEPDLQGIKVGTQAGEWLVQATANNNILTPTSIQAHRATHIGCANILPVATEHTLTFVQRFRNKLMEYFADVFSGKFSAPNLSKDARHLSLRGIAELAYQKEISPTIWARCDDGSLIGCSYKRDTLMTSQGPTYAGWHQHTLGSGRTVESLCGGPSTQNSATSSGLLETIAIVSNDSNTNIRHVEYLTNLFDETMAGDKAWFLDDAVEATVTQSVVIGGVTGMKCAGLWHLNGKTASVFCGDLDCGDFAVTNGACFVPYTTIFTFAVATAANRTLVGCNYLSEGQIVRPVTQSETRNPTGPALALKGRVVKVAGLFVNAKAVSWGTSFDRLNNCNFRTSPDGGALLSASALKTGLHVQQVDDDNSYDGMVCWRVSRPYPCTIAALAPILDTRPE